jgi:hypothetical protein
VFLGAVLHDVAKPEFTVEDGNGRISSTNHGKKGAQLARKILWRGDGFVDHPPPLAARETVSSMVRYSSLPFWLWDKDNPTRSVISASQSVRLDLLALMAEADARGRSCQDLADLLSRSCASFRSLAFPCAAHQSWTEVHRAGDQAWRL